MHRTIVPLLVLALLASSTAWFTQSASAASGPVMPLFLGTPPGGAHVEGKYWWRDGKGYVEGKVCDDAQDGRRAELRLIFAAGVRNNRVEYVNEYRGVGNCTPFYFITHHSSFNVLISERGRWYTGRSQSKDYSFRK